jgi:multiple sugar transport system permease protein
MHAIKKWVPSIATGLAVALLIIWSLIPIVWNFLTSIKTRTDIFVYPPRFLFEPTWQYYQVALGTGGAAVYKNLGNTVLIGLGSTLITIVVSTLAAYSFSRYIFRGRSTLLLVILVTRLLPPISAVIPLFMLFNGLKLVDTHLGLMLIYSALGIPFSTWMLKSFFDAVPKDIEESAKVEGCTALEALWHVTLPLALPGLAATAIFVLVLSWNEFMFAFIFSSVDARTMPVLIAQNRGDDQFFWQSMAAQATILMLPPLLMGFYLQRYLVKGLTAGAIK